VGPDQIIRRARSAMGQGCKYELGRGGNDPSSAFPWDSRKRCDCSGFSNWVLKLNRKTTHPYYVRINGGWINTDAMWLDGNEPVGIFRKLSAPRPGALIVYPRRGNRIGHVGIISGVGLDGAITSVIHCSSGNFNANGEAIQENSGAPLLRNPNSIIIWYEGATMLEEEVRFAVGRFN
jgi:cell wall-associated NlpC family hydrolase